MALECIPYNGPIITRAEARAKGLKRYFMGPGRPCRSRGHISERTTVDGGCIQCARVSSMDQDQIERKRAYSLKYAEQHRAETNAKTAERYQHLKVTDPERLKAKRLRDYAARDPEAQAASTKRWYQKKWDEQKAKRVANSAKLAEYGKAYARANPEKGRARSQRRRARTIGAEGYHIAEDVRRIGDLQKWRCHWCGKLTKDRFHVDHIKPLSKGGSNWPNNLCIACPSCNRRKSATDPIEFARRNGKLL